MTTLDARLFFTCSGLLRRLIELRHVPIHTLCTLVDAKFNVHVFKHMEVGGIERLLFGRKTLLAITGQVEGVGTEGGFVGTFHYSPYPWTSKPGTLAKLCFSSLLGLGSPSS